MIDRYAWLKAVLQSDASATAKNVASVLAVQFANRQSGQINPSRETLAGYLSVHQDTIKRCVRELRTAGWLMVKHGNGRGSKNEYRMVAPGIVIPFANQEKGDDLHCGSKERGAIPHEKGGNRTPSHIGKEHCSEHSASMRCPLDVLFPISPGSHPHEAWDDWLRRRGWPSVSELNVCHSDGWLMPRSLPPTDQCDPHDIQASRTEKFLYWAIARMNEKHEASA